MTSNFQEILNFGVPISEVALCYSSMCTEFECEIKSLSLSIRKFIVFPMLFTSDGLLNCEYLLVFMVVVQCSMKFSYNQICI